MISTNRPFGSVEPFRSNEPTWSNEPVGSNRFVGFQEQVRSNDSIWPYSHLWVQRTCLAPWARQVLWAGSWLGSKRPSDPISTSGPSPRNQSVTMIQLDPWSFSGLMRTSPLGSMILTGRQLPTMNTLDPMGLFDPMSPLGPKSPLSLISRAHWL